MNIYERFIEQMRKAGTYYNDPAIQLGKVMVGGKINVGDLLIQKEDYLMDCNLRLNTNEKIYLHTQKDGSSENLQEYKKNILYEVISSYYKKWRKIYNHSKGGGAGMMFPFVDTEEENTEEEQYIPKEYGINFETGQLSGKIVEGYDAILVWAWLALHTPRYRYYIYSEDYGQEYEDLVGKTHRRN